MIKLHISNYDLEQIHQSALQIHKDKHFKDIPTHLQGTACFIEAFVKGLNMHHEMPYIEIELPGRKDYLNPDDY